MIKKKYYHDKFIIKGGGKVYPFILANIDYPHPGVFLFADKYEGFTPHIVYLENSENVSESIEKILENPQVRDCLADCLLGISLIQLPQDRDEIFSDIRDNLGYIPKCNKLLSHYQN